MSDTPPAAEPNPAPAPARRPFAWPLAVGLALACGVIYIAAEAVAARSTAEQKPEPAAQPDEKGAKATGPTTRATRRTRSEREKKKVAAPELDGGVAWLNSGGPVTLKKDLKGKVVILDFWTLCCINCIHIMPDLAKLEKKYPNELVVIGVHSPKFENEKDTASIRKAILRYQIEHPVVNDADHKIWTKYEVDAWPTLVVIDPEGNLVGYTSGEGQLRAARRGRREAGGRAQEEEDAGREADPVRPGEVPRGGRHPAVLPGQGGGRRGRQAAVHRRQHPPPAGGHRPRREQAARDRHRRAG
jgi:thiol-disulfide isomerase/thioredoxin